VPGGVSARTVGDRRRPFRLAAAPRRRHRQAGRIRTLIPALVTQRPRPDGVPHPHLAREEFRDLHPSVRQSCPDRVERRRLVDERRIERRGDAAAGVGNAGRFVLRVGLFGQYVVVVPSERLVVTRFGVTYGPRGDIVGTSRLVGDVIAVLGTESR
jgi:hypothetical protein